MRSGTTGIEWLVLVGVVATGVALDAENPAAGVFRHAAGEAGYRIFGFVMWSAAITSVIGSAYTSISFIKNWRPEIERHTRWAITVFILISLAVFLAIGKPVQLLVLAGTVNGFILPLALAVLLLAARNTRLLNGYRHPLWLQIAGWVVTVAMAALAVKSFLVTT